MLFKNKNELKKAFRGWMEECGWDIIQGYKKRFAIPGYNLAKIDSPHTLAYFNEHPDESLELYVGPNRDYYVYPYTTVTPRRIAEYKDIEIPKQKRYRPIDYQRSKVYSWEDSKTICPHRATDDMLESVEQAQELTDVIFDTFGYSTSPVVWINPRLSRYSKWHLGKIELHPEWGLSRRVVLHEIAHALVEYGGLKGKVAPHGAEFAGIVHTLYESWLPDYDSDAAVVEAERRGVDIENDAWALVYRMESDK